MKTAFDYGLGEGTRSLKYFKFHTPGIGIYKTKSKIVEALNLGMTVYCTDKTMGTVWIYKNNEWTEIQKKTL